MGGKSHVRCQCRMYPLIPTNKSKTAKMKCNVTYFIHRNDTCIQNTHHYCKRVESFVCSNPFCVTRICKRCYDGFSTSHITTIVPNLNEPNEDIENIKKLKYIAKNRV